ncbi:MAG: pantoate--beta-alanine ligase [Ignavibacteriae bacterium]|nr:pantoate--beta-alanine ligase [Ignavibacteriota bacterium]
MKIIATVREMQETSEQLRREGKRIGVVPTMGFLHAGHTSLIVKARELSDVVITTIFVNPTQFGPGEDFERYPRDFERDCKKAEEAGSTIIFSPDVREMYPEGFASYVEVEHGSRILEGKFRPTHFRGVTTVVLKLLNITKPHAVVFGQKDAQQAFLIQKMVSDLNVETSVVVAPIVREKDGLALSSRNVYLNGTERERATQLYRSLKFAKEKIQQGERSVDILRAEMKRMLQSAQPTQIDYIAFVRPDLFQEIEHIQPPSVLIALAVRFGGTRLIDNHLVSVSS